MNRMRLLLLLSLLSFALAHRSIAHAQSIVIRGSDFMTGRSSVMSNANMTGEPMRIVPISIGRGDPTLVGSQGVPPGLLVPRTADPATSIAAAVAVQTAPAVQGQ